MTVMTKDERIGRRIKVRRAVLDISQASLAQRADIAQSYVSMIEAGERPLTADVLERIAEALECEPEDLLNERRRLA